MFIFLTAELRTARTLCILDNVIVVSSMGADKVDAQTRVITVNNLGFSILMDRE